MYAHMCTYHSSYVQVREQLSKELVTSLYHVGSRGLNSSCQLAGEHLHSLSHLSNLLWSSPSFCLPLLSTELTSVHHHNWFLPVLKHIWLCFLVWEVQTRTGQKTQCIVIFNVHLHLIYFLFSPNNLQPFLHLNTNHTLSLLDRYLLRSILKMQLCASDCRKCLEMLYFKGSPLRCQSVSNHLPPRQSPSVSSPKPLLMQPMIICSVVV